ncbi:MAG: apolipoprotein N-acyltransferase [Candidatus Omnitrophica bacterium]|nr:apolipoprotein N-acyltransferase [Candidatus Omnitrophota bacterium]
MTKKIFYCLVGGILTAISFNYPQFSFLIVISLVPLIDILGSNGRTALLGSLSFSLIGYGLIIFWLNYVVVLGYIALLLYLSFYCCFFCFFGRYFYRKPLAIVSLPAFWVLIEFLRESIWCGFGWASLGYSQFKNLYLIQSADILGVKFISFLIVLINFCVYQLLFKRRKPVLHFSLIALVFGFSFLYSVYKINKPYEVRKMRAAISQPNIDQELKWEPGYQQEIITRLKDAVEKSGPGLLIFPEAAWPVIIGESSQTGFDEFLESANKDILIGVVAQEQECFYNQALLSLSGGANRQIYRKINLVPFGEYIPLRKYLGFIDIVNEIGDMAAGSEAVSFFYQDFKFFVLICFEDTFADFVSGVARNNDFLINITNDAWFKGEPQASQHLSIMVFRAIENRISIIRSANTGVSAVVSFLGKIDSLKNKGKENFISGLKEITVEINQKRSFYSKYPHLLEVGSCFFILGLLIFSNLNSRRLRK